MRIAQRKGQDIAQLICKVLQENDIDLRNCRGQGYDNGANMAGIYRGAQAIILERNPQEMFSPSSAHSLNLCGVHAAESSPEVKSFFGEIIQPLQFQSCTMESSAGNCTFLYIGCQIPVGVQELMQLDH